MANWQTSKVCWTNFKILWFLLKMYLVQTVLWTSTPKYPWKFVYRRYSTGQISVGL